MAPSTTKLTRMLKVVFLYIEYGNPPDDFRFSSFPSDFHHFLSCRLICTMCGIADSAISGNQPQKIKMEPTGSVGIVSANAVVKDI